MNIKIDKDKTKKITNEYRFLLTLIAYGFILFLVIRNCNNPLDNWANHLGKTIGYILQTLFIALLIASFSCGFPKNIKIFRQTMSAIFLPFGVIAIISLIYVNYMEKNYANTGREFYRVAIAMRKDEIMKSELAPIIEDAKKEFPQEAVNMIMEDNSGTKVIKGWSAANIDSQNYLVKFEYQLNQSNMYLIWEYNSYTKKFELITMSEKLRENYFEKDSNTLKASIAEKIKWYGPVL